MSDRPSRLFHNLNAKIASIPMALTAMVVFLGGSIWTVVYSFTNSKLLPRAKWAGLDQYERLWGTERWLISIENLAIYGVLSLIFSLVIGFVLAALMDQKIRFEDTFRTIFLYPFALSFIVTGLVWQWLLNPEFGIQSVIRDLGFEPPGISLTGEIAQRRLVDAPAATVRRRRAGRAGRIELGVPRKLVRHRLGDDQRPRIGAPRGRNGGADRAGGEIIDPGRGRRHQALRDDPGGDAGDHHQLDECLHRHWGCLSRT